MVMKGFNAIFVEVEILYGVFESKSRNYMGFLSKG
jgi:hypothetical protein